MERIVGRLGPGNADAPGFFVHSDKQLIRDPGVLVREKDRTCHRWNRQFGSPANPCARAIRMAWNLAILFTTVVCGVTQAVLDRRGIGRIEDRGDSPTTLVLMLVSIPLTALSTMGVLVISLWSLFKLPLIPTVAVLIAGFVVYGLVLGNVYARIQRSELALAALYAFGLPAVLATRTVATIGAIYLTITFLR